MANPNPVHKFEVGEVNNPLGRPKKEFSMTEAFKEVLSETDPATKIERYKIIIEKAVSLATRGDTDMIKYIINRLEGMPQGSGNTLNFQFNNFSEGACIVIRGGQPVEILPTYENELEEFNEWGRKHPEEVKRLWEEIQ